MSETSSNATWAGWLEVAINRSLRSEPGVLAECAALEGRLLVLALSDLRREVTVRFGADGVQLLPGADPEADTVIRGGIAGLLRLAAGEGGVGALSAQGVRVEGDTELADRFRAILLRARPDLEDLLARVTGDVVAHTVGYSVRRLGDWARRGAETLRQDLAEYLRYESGDLVGQPEVEDFLADVDRLRDDLARLEARVRALSGARGAGDDDAQ